MVIITFTMWNPHNDPTVAPILAALLASLRETLSERFVGLALYGSLASGDFDPTTSDIDFLVITGGELPDALIPALEAMHARLWVSDDPWAHKLEGSYLPQAALRRYHPDDPARPTVNEGRFYLARHGQDWIIQRHILREHGVTLAGPNLRDLIDPVPASAIRHAVRDNLLTWWRPMLDNPARLASAEYQAYAVLTMCRALYTLEHGDIASKPASARWALTALAPRWRNLIAQAADWRPGQPFDHLADVQALIREAIERSQ